MARTLKVEVFEPTPKKRKLLKGRSSDVSQEVCLPVANLHRFGLGNDQP